MNRLWKWLFFVVACFEACLPQAHPMIHSFISPDPAIAEINFTKSETYMDIGLS